MGQQWKAVYTMTQDDVEYDLGSIEFAAPNEMAAEAKAERYARSRAATAKVTPDGWTIADYDTLNVFRIVKMFSRPRDL